MENERALIENVLQGDKDAFRVIVEAYSPKVFALIISMVDNREDAEELAQDVFVKVYFSLQKFKSDSSLSTWIYRISYNTAISRLRKKRRLVCKDEIEKFPVIDSDFEEEKEKKWTLEENYTKLESALKTISQKDRFLIDAFYYRDLKIAEIAEITEQSTTNVKTRLFRIRGYITKFVMEK